MGQNICGVFVVEGLTTNILQTFSQGGKKINHNSST